MKKIFMSLVLCGLVIATSTKKEDVDSSVAAFCRTDEIQIQNLNVLGYHVEETIEEYAEKHPIEEVEEEVIVETPYVKKQEAVAYMYDSHYFEVMGVIDYNGYKFTWYSQKVLPGGGLNIPGRHVDGNRYIVDGDGYLVVASDSLPYGSIVGTPFGLWGKVYDCGTGAPDIIDVYCNF